MSVNKNIQYTNSLDAISQCLSLGASEFVISTGARNAELIYSILNINNIDYYSHPDERSASFFALGRALSTRKPVVMLTTSGTAVAELLPACIEAYYQSAPLILLTADRPIRYQNSGAPQSINQIDIFGQYAETDFHKWKYNHPLHINVHLEEPNLKSLNLDTLKDSKPSPQINDEKTSNTKVLEDFFDTDETINIIVGTLNIELRDQVLSFIERSNCATYAESVSGLREKISSIHSSEIKAERILRIGGIPSCRYWRDLEDNEEIKVLSVTPNNLPGLSRSSNVITSVNWNEVKVNKRTSISTPSGESERIDNLLKKYPNSEPSFIRKISEIIPNNSMVFLGNSLPIREWQIAATRSDKDNDFYANRGVNGIDGNISTFLGISKDYNSSCGIFGDLTTLYDLNSLWFLEQINKTNVHIFVINNGGGKIFDHVQSLKDTPEVIMNTIKNSHTLDFSSWANMWKLDYSLFHKISDLNDLNSNRSVIEIIPNDNETHKFWNEFKNK